MDITKINVVLNEMNKYKNYDEFMRLLSFDERKYILYNFLDFFENYRIFSDERFCKYFFSEEELNLLYAQVNMMSEASMFFLAISGNDELKKKIIPLVSEDFKTEIINSLENEKNKIAMFDLINDDYNKAFLLYKINDLKFKLNYIKKIDLSIADNHSIFSTLVDTINDDNTLIQIIDFLINEFPSVDVCKYDTIIKFGNDELKLKYIDKLSTIYYQLLIVKTLDDDYKKINFIKNFEIASNDISTNNSLCDVICSLKNDSLILESLYLLNDNNFYVYKALSSLKNDQLKLQNLHLAKDYQCALFASIKSDSLKINNIDLLSKQKFSNFNQVIDSIRNVEQRFELISKYIDDLNIYGLVHADYLDKVKIIYPKIISAVADYYQISNYNLTKLIEKYGYNAIKFLENDNIKALVNYTSEDFDKTIKIFEIQKAKQLEMKDVDDIIGSLLQREFRFSNRNIITIFSDLEVFIDNKNINEIIAKLEEINKTFNINEIFIQYSLNYEEFLNGLLSEKVEFKNILHEITDKYINLKRAEYLLANKEEIKEELNLEKAYEKNYLLTKMFSYVSIDRIYDLILKLDKSNFNNEQLNLINNESILRECLLFRKNPKEYSGDFSVKSKIKLLNQILTQLYLSKEIDYLGENDLDAKVIFKTKPSDKDSIFKIIQEINFDNLKNNVLNNQELYDKLQKTMATYHFLGWNDIFESLLCKADLIFDESCIGAFISYFYDFYPKLEEKVRIGKIKNISLTSIIDEISVYGNSSIKYKYLLGTEDYSIFLTNSGPNAAHTSKEDRLKEIPIKIREMYTRKHITIPPINNNFRLSNNKFINVSVGNVTKPINFTYGERTGACMRIGGPGRTLFDFCLSNENGFHVCLSDPDNNKFVSRVSGFRNGNTVFLNELRNSVSDKYSNEDLYEAIKVFSKMLVDLTKDSKYPIKNIVISDGYVMGSHSKERTSLDINPKDGFKHFYSDVGKDNAIMLFKTDEIKLGVEEVEKYEVTRKKINCFVETEDIRNSVQQIKLINELLRGEELGDIELFPEGFIEQISKLYVGEDWFIALDSSNQIILKYAIEKDDISKRIIEFEISKVEENINTKSYDSSSGGKSI